MEDEEGPGEDETPKTESPAQSNDQSESTLTQKSTRETVQSATEQSEEFYEATSEAEAEAEPEHEEEAEVEASPEPDSDTVNGVEAEDKDQSVEDVYVEESSLEQREQEVTVRTEQIQKTRLTTRTRNTRLNQRQFHQMIGKHETRNEELGKRQGDLRQRLDMLECSMPAVMVWNTWRMAQGNSIGNLRRVVQKQFREGEVYCPITPSRHYDCRVREVEAERKHAQKRAEEARALWTEKESALEERRNMLEEAKQIQEERAARIQQLRKEAQELRDALATLESDGSCVAGECGDIQCRERLLGKVASVCSISSADVECLEKLNQLAENEICIKRQITDLERREDAYMRILQQADELWGKMEGDTASTVSALQELLDMKTATNQKLADRICELEDQLEKLRSRMAHCRAELEKFMSISKIEAAIGRDSDLAEASDMGAGGDDDLAGTVDVGSLAQAEGADKYASARPDQAEFGMDAATPEDIAYEAEKQQELADYFAMLANIDDLYTDDVPCAPDFVCNDVVTSLTEIEPEEGREPEMGMYQSIIDGYDLTGVDIRALLEERDSEAQPCASGFVCNDVVESPIGMDAEEMAPIEAASKPYQVPSHVSSEQAFVPSVPEQFSDKFEEDTEGIPSASMLEQPDIVEKTMQDGEVDGTAISIDIQDASTMMETEEIAAPQEDGVVVPRFELISWLDTSNLIRSTVADCPKCSVVKPDADQLAERIALYAGVKLEGFKEKLVTPASGVSLKEEEVIAEQLLTVPSGEEDAGGMPADANVYEADVGIEQAESEVDRRPEPEEQVMIKSEEGIIKSEEAYEPEEEAVIKLKESDLSIVREIAAQMARSDATITEADALSIKSEKKTGGEILDARAPLEGTDDAKFFEAEHPPEPPSTPVSEPDDVEADKAGRTGEAKTEQSGKKPAEEGVEGPQPSGTALDVEGGEALPVTVITKDEVPRDERAELVDEVREIEAEKIITVEDAEGVDKVKFALEEGVDERKEMTESEDVKIEEREGVADRVEEAPLKEIETETKEETETEKVDVTEEEKAPEEAVEGEELVAVEVTQIEEGEEGEKPVDLEMSEEKKSAEAIPASIEGEEPPTEAVGEIEEKPSRPEVEELEEVVEKEEEEKETVKVPSVERVKERPPTAIDPRLVAKPYLAVAEIERKITSGSKQSFDRKATHVCKRCMLGPERPTASRQQASFTTTDTIKSDSVETEIIKMATEVEETTKASEPTVLESSRTEVHRAEAIQTEVALVETVQTEIRQTEAVQTIISSIISAGTQTWSAGSITVYKRSDPTHEHRGLMQSRETSPDKSTQKPRWRNLPRDQSTITTASVATQTSSVSTRGTSRYNAVRQDDVSTSARAFSAVRTSYDRGKRREGFGGWFQDVKNVGTEEEMRSPGYRKRSGDRDRAVCDCCVCGKGVLPIPTSLLKRFVATHLSPRLSSKVSSKGSLRISSPVSSTLVSKMSSRLSSQMSSRMSSRMSSKLTSDASKLTSVPSAGGSRDTSMPVTALRSERLCSECRVLKRALLEQQTREAPVSEVQEQPAKTPVPDSVIQDSGLSTNTEKVKPSQKKKKKEVEKKDQCCTAKIPKVKGNGCGKKKKSDMQKESERDSFECACTKPEDGGSQKLICGCGDSD